MLNALARRRSSRASPPTPGRTRALQFFDVAYRPTPAARPRRVRFCDLPGYGYAKVSRDERDRWAAMIEDYLRERKDLRAVVLIVDARHPPSESDHDALAFLRATGRRVIVAATKIDKLAKTRRGAALRAVERSSASRAARPCPFSAIEGTGTDALWARLAAAAPPRRRPLPRRRRRRPSRRPRRGPVGSAGARGGRPASTPMSRWKSWPVRAAVLHASPIICRISSPRFGANMRPSPAPDEYAHREQAEPGEEVARRRALPRAPSGAGSRPGPCTAASSSSSRSSRSSAPPPRARAGATVRIARWAPPFPDRAAKRRCGESSAAHGRLHPRRLERARGGRPSRRRQELELHERRGDGRTPAGRASVRSTSQPATSKRRVDVEVVEPQERESAEGNVGAAFPAARATSTSWRRSQRGTAARGPTS